MKKFILTIIVLSSSLFIKAQHKVDFYTSMGNFEVEIYDDLVPITGGNFLKLVDEKYYDGLLFHRVIDDFMIQGGEGGATVPTILDEFLPSLKNVPKYISMANIGQPNTGRAQFFINLVTNSHLDNKHSVFGMVTKDYNIVETIAKVTTDGNPPNGNNRPLTDVVIDSIRIQTPVGIGTSSRVNININVFPNPTDGVFKLKLDKLYSNLNIKIYNTAGSLINELNNVKGEEIQIELQGPSGYYFVQVQSGNDQSSIKILKKIH
jgi:cyclophilin family peptidyl-prolyl cis-trans isomerase